MFPKKCGRLDNKEVISLDEYIAKIRAAAAARRNPDLLLIAQTDARAVIGVEQMINRAISCRDGRQTHQIDPERRTMV